MWSGMRLAARITYSDSSLHDSDSLCSTVATSSELVATVDLDGHSINSTGAQTPHEPLSTLLMRFSCGSRDVAITLTSAPRQRVGRRPRPPLIAARSAVKAGACAESCICRTLDFALGALTRCSNLSRLLARWRLADLHSPRTKARKQSRQTRLKTVTFTKT